MHWLGLSHSPIFLDLWGANPTTVDDTITAMLDDAILQLHERMGSTEKSQIDAICVSLATLRPLVPISVLASVSNVPDSMVKSFAMDLGRPLLVIGDSIQFRDEPVETWFRERFRPNDKQLTSFISTLQPLASTSAYVASTLPQLMLEAGQLSELIDLALSSSSLPIDSPIEKRDVELQRLQFALKASLRKKRFVDATKISLKAGEETAGNARQQTLLQNNTDLVAALMDPDRIQEIISRRTFGGGWIGAHHAYEAALFSYVSEFRGDARSRLRMADEWLSNWSRLPKDKRDREKIDDLDIAEMAVTCFNIGGPKACAVEIRRWKPRNVSFRVGCIIAQRLIDHGRYGDIDQLANEAGNNIWLLLAISLELRKVHRIPPQKIVERSLRFVMNRRVKLKLNHFDSNEVVIQGIIALLQAAYSYRLCDNDILASILSRYLPEEPPRGLASRFNNYRMPYLRAYALLAALKGECLQLIDLAYPDLRKQLEDKRSHQPAQDIQEFKESIGVLLPWYILWAESVLSPHNCTTLKNRIAEVRKEYSGALKYNYRDVSYISNEIAVIWFDIIMNHDISDVAFLEDFNCWANNLKQPLFTPTWISFARVCSHTVNFEKYAYTFAARAFELTKNEKFEAESKAQTYVEIARAVVKINKEEAGAYVNRAIEVVSKVGDDIYDRWQALLDLAASATDPERPVPETAYRLGRSAEVVESYDSRHFNWQRTVTAITGLCPSSSLSILSRWRDRHVGRTEDLLATTIHYLLGHQRIDSAIALALIGFREQWKYSLLLKKGLEAKASPTDRGRMMGYLLHYMRLDEQSSAAWNEVKEIATINNLIIQDIDHLIQFHNREEVALKRANNTQTYSNAEIDRKLEEKDWDTIFLNLDLHTPNGLSSAYASFMSGEPPFYHERFFEELLARVAVGKESELVRVFSDAAEFDLYDFHNFIKQVPESWKSQMSVKSALIEAVKRICIRNCMKITNDRYYNPCTLHAIADLCCIPEQDLINIVITATGEVTEIINSGRLYTLVGLLASKLTHAEALDALNFGLSLLDDILDENDGDGPWTDALNPPSDINAAVAGYIWSSLAAPEASFRWEAAHVVRGLCELRVEAVLGHLVALAHSNTSGPFADARLHFYNFHARQWLLIALSRAAIDHPAVLLPHADFFMHYALKDEPHVLIRHFAAKAALALVNSGNLKLDEKVISELNAINVSPLTVVASKRYERHKKQVHPMHRESGAKRFSFDYDMSRYWFEALADLFAVSSSDIEIEAEKIICDEWRLSENGHWDQDERARRGIYIDREPYHSHGSYPRTDNLNFYLSYHAMMIVAGKLLAAVPLHQDPDDPDNEFSCWLRRHTLTRQNGFWLFDRRVSSTA